jgi:signal transduction histidine kinase/CheY-like chemotaxis protein
VIQSHFNHRLLIQLKRRMPIGKRTEQDLFFIAFCLSAVVFLVPISVVLQWAQLQASAYTAYAGMALVLLCMFIWKNTQQRQIALLIYELTLLALVLVNAYLLGGVTSPVMVWLGIVPLLPLFIASLRWAYVFLGLAFLSVLLFYAVSWGIPNQPNARSSTDQIFAALMFCSFILTQMVLISTVVGITANRMRKIANDNKRLRTIYEQMSLVNEHKDKFLSSVSHEMRTPLNVIHGYMELLRTRSDLPAEAHDQIEQASGASTHMLSLINDLLDYSQIHQGQFTLANQPVELPVLLMRVFNSLEIQAQNKGLGFVYEKATSLPDWVETDPTRLTQILLNLLGNALKFTVHGQIQLQVSYTPPSCAHEGTLHMHIRDTGPGIPAVVLTKIFDPFYQLHNKQLMHSGHALQGNGLGLAITQALVKKWQGQIEVTSTEGKGSTFKVSIPVAESSQTSSTPIQEQTSLGSTPMSMRILVVDDHALNRLVASATIRKHLPECHIEQAENGQQALHKMATQHYDAVLLDIVMPDLSGIEVLQTVRQTYPAPFCHVRTFAFTANVEADIKSQCENTGFDGFLSKPFNVQTLIQTLTQPRVAAAHVIGADPVDATPL